MAEDAQLGFRPGDDLFDGLGDGSGPLVPHFPGGAAGQEPAIQQTEQALGPWVDECDTRHLRKPPRVVSVPGWRYGSTNDGGYGFLGVAGINYLIILSYCRRTVFGIGDRKPARLGPAPRRRSLIQMKAQK
jgi:hypothetical protein